MRISRCGGLRRGFVAACAAVALAMPTIGHADDDVDAATRAADADAEEAPPENPFGGGGPPIAQAPAPAVPPGLVHSQVNMAGFTRDYRPVPIDVAEADVAIRAALDRRIDGVWEFQDASLRETVGRLRDFLQVPVVLDERTLADAGIDPDGQTVTTRLSGMTARAALRVLLTPLDLASVAADEVLTITTREKAWERLTQVAYPLPRWSGVAGDGCAQAVVEVVQGTVAAQSWDVVGGPGSIRVVEAAGEPLLVISQTSDVHDAVERLLRALHGRAIEEFDGGRPVLKVHQVADDRARADLEQRIKDLCNGTLGADADPDAEVTAVAATLVVRSKSPLFHALAAQLVAAVVGRPNPQPPMGGIGGGAGGQ